jgi:hypothetical protein
MLKRRMSFSMLVGFAVIMVAALMLEDPTGKQNEMLAFRATREAQRPLQLFPDIQPEHIIGLEVLDVTASRGILVMRDERGLWYAPSIPGIQNAVAANLISQDLVEQAATAITYWGSEQWYEATALNLDSFGLSPAPRHRIRFRVRDASGRNYEATAEIGNANLDNVAYYVYIPATSDENQRIFLIPKQLVDFVLNMLSEPLLVPSTVDASTENSEVGAPVP